MHALATTRQWNVRPSLRGRLYRALVAALLDDPNFESNDRATRLVHRLRIADDVKLLLEVDGQRVEVADHDGTGVINIACDEPFIHSLERLGFVSLPPAQDAGT